MGRAGGPKADLVEPPPPPPVGDAVRTYVRAVQQLLQVSRDAGTGASTGKP